MTFRVPHRFRNMINPHQTTRELRKQCADAERVYQRLPEDQRRAFTREDEEDRDWTWQGRVIP